MLSYALDVNCSIMMNVPSKEIRTALDANEHALGVGAEHRSELCFSASAERGVKGVDMTVATFDTLKYANTLKAAGVPDKQAEAQAFVLAEGLTINLKDLVTKDDLKLTKEELKQALIETEQHMNSKIDLVRPTSMARWTVSMQSPAGGLCSCTGCLAFCSPLVFWRRSGHSCFQSDEGTHDDTPRYTTYPSFGSVRAVLSWRCPSSNRCRRWPT